VRHILYIILYHTYTYIAWVYVLFGSGSIDLLLNTIPADFNWRLYQRLIAPGGRCETYIIYIISYIYIYSMCTLTFLGWLHRFTAEHHPGRLGLIPAKN